MSIKASVNQIETFSSSVDYLKSDYENGVNITLNVCDILEKSIKNLISGIDNILSQIETDLSSANFVLDQNNTLYYRLESKKEYAEKRLPQVQDEQDIKNYQKTISDCTAKMDTITSKNQQLQSIISQLENLRNKYNELKRTFPSVESTIQPTRKNLESLKSNHYSLCSKYSDKAFSAQKSVTQIDENLSYVAEISPSCSRVVTVHNARSLTDMAQSLRAISDRIYNHNSDLNSGIGTFSSIIQDEVSRNAIQLCSESAQTVEHLIENFDDLANHFAHAAQYLREYENLV